MTKPKSQTTQKVSAHAAGSAGRPGSIELPGVNIPVHPAGSTPSERGRRGASHLGCSLLYLVGS